MKTDGEWLYQILVKRGNQRKNIWTKKPVRLSLLPLKRARSSKG